MLPSFRAGSHPAGGSSERKKFGRKSARSQRKQEHYDVKRNTLFTVEEIEDYQQVFDFYDVNDSKTITFKDLEKSFSSLGFRVSAAEMKELIAALEVDEDRSLDFDEFCAVIKAVRGNCSQRYDVMRNAFLLLDCKNQGFVAVEDFVQLIKDKEEMTVLELDELIKFADESNSGKIFYDKLIDKMKEQENQALLNAPQISASSTVSSGMLDGEKSEENQKPSREKEKVIKLQDSPRNIEVVDDVTKAIAGPILLNSAIIIKYGQCSRKRK